jgi:phenylacetic acid degradation operon negative regulatory protein
VDLVRIEYDGSPSPPAGISLLMVLGMYLLDDPPSHEQRCEVCWQETLVLSLEHLGYTNHAARQAVARATRRGILAAQRQGRRARMSLTDAGQELLRDGARRLLAFGEPWSWDGCWLLLNLRVPESRRDARQRLRTRLSWAGFGSLGNGLWLSPHLDRERELSSVLSAEPAAQAWTFRARSGEFGDVNQLVRQAWDIDAMITNYDLFIAEFARVQPRTLEECFVSYITLWSRWRLFPFIDPDLPAELFPKGWLRERAYAMFQERCHRWVDPARRFVASLEPGEVAATAAFRGTP